MTYKLKDAIPFSRYKRFLEEWDFAKNGNLQLRCQRKSSARTTWWVCSICGDAWKCSIRARLRSGSNCPKCDHRDKISNINLAVLRPEVLLYWDYMENKDVSPMDVTPGSERVVSWRCKECGHCWKSRIYQRAGLSKKEVVGCPACFGLVPNKFNNVEVLHPHLVKEWDFIKNFPRIPRNTVAGTGSKVWWKCLKSSDHEWEAPVEKRAKQGRGRGCPFCASRKVSNTNRLSDIRPDLSKEWDTKKNKKFPNEIVVGSGSLAWWVCSVCNYSWRTRVNNRSMKGSGCPSCRGQVVSNTNRLSVLYPELTTEWDYEKNYPLTPQTVSSRSSKKVFWVCSSCDNRWETFVFSRTGSISSGCPRCSKGLGPEYNLLHCFPEIAKDWHPNNQEGPDKVYPKSSFNALWRCTVCEYEWRAQVFNRTCYKVNGRGFCPQCSSAGVSKISQVWLDFLNVPFSEREVSIFIEGKNYKVDAYVPETNTVYEFLGDYWHGNPEIFPNGINVHNKKSFCELYQKTVDRLESFENAGYNVEYIWENEFKKLTVSYKEIDNG